MEKFSNRTSVDCDNEEDTGLAFSGELTLTSLCCVEEKIEHMSLMVKKMHMASASNTPMQQLHTARGSRRYPAKRTHASTALSPDALLNGKGPLV